MAENTLVLVRVWCLERISCVSVLHLFQHFRLLLVTSWNQGRGAHLPG